MEKRKEQQEKSLRAFQKELQGLFKVQEQLSDQGDKLYVSVRLDRKVLVLDTYHNAVLGESAE